MDFKLTEEQRLPLLPVSPASRAKLDEAMEFAGIYKLGKKKIKKVGKR